MSTHISNYLSGKEYTTKETLINRVARDNNMSLEEARKLVEFVLGMKERANA